MARQPMPDVVVLLPGILGSVLRRHREVVWGYGAASIGKALLTLGRSMERNLALPHDDPTRDDLGDEIVADALMPDLHLIPGFWKIDGYTRLAEALAAGFELRDGENFFSFPYDWRRDNRVASRKLGRVTSDWLASWRQSSGNAQAKLILIAHSMGGLICRHFLECSGGWENTRVLVTFGTPYRGSLNALDMLANGVKKGPFDMSNVARQFTAIYQLLPVFECYDGGDGKLVRVGETTGIPNVDAARAAAALAFHHEIESAVATNRNLPAHQHAGPRVYPVVGIAQQTSLSARRDGDKLTMLQTYQGKPLAGDGTVPRVSAIPLEMSDAPAAMYAGTQHGSLQNADAVLVHLAGVLSGLSIDLGSFMKPKITVALEVEDLFLPGEPISVRARPSQETALTATLSRHGDTASLASMDMIPGPDAWFEVTFSSLIGGAYRVTVGGSGVEEAEDAFAVVEPGEIS